MKQCRLPGKDNSGSISNMLPLLVVLSDYLAIIAAEQSAIWLRDLLMHATRRGFHVSWLNFWIIFPLIFLIFLQIEQLYNRNLQFWQTLQKIFYACVYAIIAVIIEIYLGQIARETSRLFVCLFGGFAFLYIAVLRYLGKHLLGGIAYLYKPVLILGAGKTAEILVRGLQNEIVGVGYRTIGFLEDRPLSNEMFGRYPILGKFADAEKVIRETGVRHVIIAAPAMDQQALTKLIDRIQPLVSTLCVVPNLVGIPISGIEVESFFTEKLLMLRLHNNLARPLNHVFKRIFDLILTIAGILLIWPFMALVAFLIKIDSAGPAMYNAERVGKQGRLFKCYKFRSMRTDGDAVLADYLAQHPERAEEWHNYHKLDDDPRVTRFGALLRRTSIDELPQIFNVLRGEMSLVGPRPYLPREVDEMGEAYDIITIAKPGITGLWQVSGRSNTTYEERLLMDTWYVRNWSIWVDIWLLWRTIGVVLGRKGAK